jgi:hypothetical protein
MRPIDLLRQAFPGEWKWKGRRWVGPDFNVIKSDYGFLRLDTWETFDVVDGKAKNRSFFDPLPKVPRN